MVFAFTFSKAAHPEDAMVIMNMSDYMFWAGTVSAADPNCYPYVEANTDAYIYPFQETRWQKFIGSQNSNIPINDWTVYTGPSTQYTNLPATGHPILSLAENYANWGGYHVEYNHPVTGAGGDIQIGHDYKHSTNTCYNSGQTHVDQYIQAFTFTGTNAQGGVDYILYIDNI